MGRGSQFKAEGQEALTVRLEVTHLQPPAGQPRHDHNNKRPLTPKSMSPTGDEHAKLKT